MYVYLWIMLFLPAATCVLECTLNVFTQCCFTTYKYICYNSYLNESGFEWGPWFYSSFSLPCHTLHHKCAQLNIYKFTSEKLLSRNTKTYLPRSRWHLFGPKVQPPTNYTHWLLLLGFGQTVQSMLCTHRRTGWSTFFHYFPIHLDQRPLPYPT